MIYVLTLKIIIKGDLVLNRRKTYKYKHLGVGNHVINCVLFTRSYRKRRKDGPTNIQENGSYTRIKISIFLYITSN